MTASGGTTKLSLRGAAKRRDMRSKGAPLAQLDRASVYGTEGWRFESSRACHLRSDHRDRRWDSGHSVMRDSAEARSNKPLPPLCDVAGDEALMRLALREAERAAERGEAPIGAVIVAADGTVLGKAHNQRELLQDPTAHAEILAITQAAAALGSWRLEGTTAYVTLEPCVMCAGALVNARVGRLVYGASNPKAGACGTLYDVVRDRRLNHRLEVIEGVGAEQSAALLRAFFAARRSRDEDEVRRRAPGR